MQSACRHIQRGGQPELGPRPRFRATPTGPSTHAKHRTRSRGTVRRSTSGVASIDAFPWGHRWGHAAHNTDISGMHDSHNHAISVTASGALWARLDSNQGPTD